MDTLLAAGKVTKAEADRVKAFIADNQVALTATNEPQLQAVPKRAKLAGVSYSQRVTMCANPIGKRLLELMVG